MKHWKVLVASVVVGLVMSGAWMARAQEIVIGFSGPLSGPAAEYGQDMLYGIDMAVNEINAGGGITVSGKKHKIKLEKLDDRSDPTAAVNNARRFRNMGAIAVYNGVFTTIAAMNKINQEKGNEFLLMAYTSTPKLYEMGNKLLIGTTAPPFTVYLDQFIASAMKKGYKKVAMVVTAGAYGEEWRDAFRERWTKVGGTVTADKPANYYTETDFSAPLAAALATKPEAMLIGGPSATTALVIEQARGMGFKGAFIVIDQAKLDFIDRQRLARQRVEVANGIGGQLGLVAGDRKPLVAAADHHVDDLGVGNAAESEQAGEQAVTHGRFHLSENTDYRRLAFAVLSPFPLRGSLSMG